MWAEVEEGIEKQEVKKAAEGKNVVAGIEKIPTGWTETTLGKIIKISSGKGLVKAQQAPDGEYIVYGGNGVIGRHCEYSFDEQQLIIGRVGVYCGNVHITQKKSWITDNAFIVDFNRKEISINFLYHLLNVLNLNKYSSSTAQPVISQGKIYPIIVSLPPLSEQQAIVAKIEELLSELDNGKEQLETARQQLKVYRQAVLKWAYEGKLTNETVSEGKLPEGWKPVTLSQICHIIGGVTKGRDFKGKETIKLPYLRVANVQDGFLNLKEIKEIEVLPTDKEKYQLVAGDILYTEGGDRDKLGRGAIWKDEIEDCIHQNHIFRARPLSEEINSKFVAYFSQTLTAKNYFLKHGKQTTNLASINLTVLKNLPLQLPQLPEQNQIVQEIESRLSVCDKLEETIAQSLLQSESLRQSILKKAFEGKL